MHPNLDDTEYGGGQASPSLYPTPESNADELTLELVIGGHDD
jgi:hypothetical protein